MSSFYTGNPLLNNVNAMVTDNINLYISTNNVRGDIISIPISNPNNYNVLDVLKDTFDLTNSLITDLVNGFNTYYINDMVYSAYDNSIYYITQKNLNNDNSLYNFLVKYDITKNITISNQQFIVGFTPTQTDDDGPLKSGLITVMGASSNGYIILCHKINNKLLDQYNTPTVRFIIIDLTTTPFTSFTPRIVKNAHLFLSSSSSNSNPDISMNYVDVYSITTNNADTLYIIGTVNTAGLNGQVDMTTVTNKNNTFLFVFTNSNGSNNLTTIFNNSGNYYMLSATTILYSTILYNNGFLYFTQNTSNANSSNYVVKTNLSGTVINQTNYLGGASSNGGGMTFDSNGNFYVTYDFIPSTPNNTSILATLVPPCFKSGTLILTNKGYFPVESLQSGDLIQTYKHGFVPIYKIGKKEIYHPAENSRIKSQLYRCSQNKYPELFEDLIITGCHSILVDSFESEEQKNKIIEVNNDAYGTDGKIRLPACVDLKTTVYEKEGTYTIYHFALENDDYYMNYGIYANGLLVETCSKRYITELANMDII